MYVCVCIHVLCACSSGIFATTSTSPAALSAYPYVLTFPPHPPPLQVWDRESLECTKVLKGHSGSVLCLQYDEQVIVTGSSDATIRCVVVDSH